MKLEKRTYAVATNREPYYKEVSGYVFDSGIEYFYPVLIRVDNRHPGEWYLSDLITGLAIGGWHSTRKAAIEAFEKRYRKPLEKLVKAALLSEHAYYAEKEREFNQVLGVWK